MTNPSSQSTLAQQMPEPVNAQMLEALKEVFCIGDRLVSDVYGSEFVHNTRSIMSAAEAAQAGIAQQVPAVPEGWQPIETAPKDGSYFLALHDGLPGVWVAHWSPVAVSGYRFDDPWRTVMMNHYHIAAEHRYKPATRWMPLPTAPVQNPSA